MNEQLIKNLLWLANIQEEPVSQLSRDDLRMIAFRLDAADKLAEEVKAFSCFCATMLPMCVRCRVIAQYKEAVSPHQTP